MKKLEKKKKASPGLAGWPKAASPPASSPLRFRGALPDSRALWPSPRLETVLGPFSALWPSSPFGWRWPYNKVRNRTNFNLNSPKLSKQRMKFLEQFLFFIFYFLLLFFGRLFIFLFLKDGLIVCSNLPRILLK